MNQQLVEIAKLASGPFFCSAAVHRHSSVSAAISPLPRAGTAGWPHLPPPAGLGLDRAEHGGTLLRTGTGYGAGWNSTSTAIMIIGRG